MENIRVTIGMPVYNGEHTIRNAIESVLSQTYSNFVFIISDNASTDATSEICRYYAGRDKRVMYVRQQENIGAEANFLYVLSWSKTEYFFWATADDIRSNDFLELNINFLDNNPEYVCSTCRSKFENGEYNPIRMGDETRDEDQSEDRIINFFKTWHANSRFCSLFRRRLLVQAYCQSKIDYFGGDWSVILRLLEIGKTNRIDSGYVVLGKKGISNSVHIFARYRTSYIHWFIPFWNLSVFLFKLAGKFSFRGKLKLVKIVLLLNLRAARAQLRCELRRKGIF